MPEIQNSANLADCISSITCGGRSSFFPALPKGIQLYVWVCPNVGEGYSPLFYTTLYTIEQEFWKLDENSFYDICGNHVSL